MIDHNFHSACLNIFIFIFISGIVIDTRDVLSGDAERYDVADSIVRLLLRHSDNNVNGLATNQICYSIINKKGDSLNDIQWEKILSLFTVPQADLMTTRSS